ncbi:alpha/beta hydrolase [Antrihabitans cavernicola]|uniref:Alpha/beta hydrolase n=2 Tax=Antrihabitans cavernicola TaxID=2495913 RepID=A0A5A7S8M7_9NOCA|nr:alpha/beta hydrolase [Spelaeibacter cavernicola]
MGFSCQLIHWPLNFCQLLVDAGYRVIRFDNRDIGLSTKFDSVRLEGSQLLRMARFELGLPSPVPYTLVDMAADTDGLLDHLGIDSVHVVGASMGGMIAQVYTAEHPDRVASLGILFSNTNQALMPPPHPAAIRTLLESPGRNPTREQIVAKAVQAHKVIGSPKYPEAEDVTAARAGEAFDRSYSPAGIVRQFGATLGTGSLLSYSTRITAPTVVVHGSADRLIRPAGGRAVAKAIRGATLHIVDGMGHDLPQQLHTELTGYLLSNFAAVRPRG